jgi:transposase
MTRLITSLSHGVPPALSDVAMLGRTLTRRAGDILTYFGRPGTSNGPTEAIQRPTRAPARHRLGFRNMTNYVARSLLETG